MSRLIAQKLQKDKKILEAKRLLHEALAEHQKSIKGIKGPDPGKLPDLLLAHSRAQIETCAPG